MKLTNRVKLFGAKSFCKIDTLIQIITKSPSEIGRVNEPFRMMKRNKATDVFILFVVVLTKEPRQILKLLQTLGFS
jgi:hypothetical protein